MDWFIYDRYFRHERVKGLTLLDDFNLFKVFNVKIQIGGIGSRQTSHMKLFATIVNI